MNEKTDPRTLVRLDALQPTLNDTLARAADRGLMRRIWAHDHTVWQPDPTEISNRLGWLDIASRLADKLEPIQALVAGVRADGYTHAVLLGMGGSSLAPEVFRLTFGVAPGHLDLAVLDSTDADVVRALADRLDPARTLFIVSTKSGTTVETLSFFKYFYNWTAVALGPEAAGAHFVAITDPGSKLARTAAQFGFRAVFENDPNIGGRYSALSYFGLVPAFLVGVDVPLLLQRARDMMSNNMRAGQDNLGLWLGTVMGEAARQGRDKITLVTSAPIASFGDWVEQLIAESTGKNGTGILPVVGELVGGPAVYGQDRLFVHLQLAGDESHVAALDALADAGYPVVRFTLADKYDLGAHYFLWEMATAVAGHHLGIHPFDQPNVESAKKLARKMVAAFQETGKLPEAETAPLSAAALSAFLAQAHAGDYIALQAYVPATPTTEAALQTLRRHLRNRTRLATTLGYGPRFLHSTGQLHKGDRGNGLFIQFTSSPEADVPIPDAAGLPDAGMTFDVLKQAQALGDYEALRGATPPRRVIRFEVGGDVDAGIQQLRPIQKNTDAE
ncbi:MAG: hypothetical protein KC418_13275 [Anaerolineales bacterium]|nr:hypothetical protein [Anaerolineales bacterium]MCB8954023.1 glucose-6-phosphate isomerase [Ardenticatenales bacterium]